MSVILVMNFFFHPLIFIVLS